VSILLIWKELKNISSLEATVFENTEEWNSVPMGELFDGEQWCPKLVRLSF
jgi:hypothetical protein